MQNHQPFAPALPDYPELEGEFIFPEEVHTRIPKTVLAKQIKQEMQKQGFTITSMAKRLQTSRAALNRLLDPSNSSVTLQTISRTAKVLGKRVDIQLVNP